MDVAALATSVVRTRAVSYANAASISLLVLDYFITLDREIRSIWMSKWNYTKLMYVITRYTSFIECVVVIIQLSIPGDWYYGCAIAFKTNAWLYVCGLGTGEIIMTLRTWAVWEQNRAVKWVLLICLLLLWGGGLTFTGIFLQSIEFEPNPRTPYIGCYATYTSPIIFLSWVILLLFDTVMFVLMAIPAFKAYRAGGQSRLIKLVYRDGVVYYLYLFVVSLLNIVITLSFPSDLLLVFTLMSRAVHCILACRVMLHIDAFARKARYTGQSMSIP